MLADSASRAVLRVLRLVRDGALDGKREPPGDVAVLSAILYALRDEGAVESMETPTYPGAPPSVSWSLTERGREDISRLENGGSS